MEKYNFVNFNKYTFHEKSRVLQSFLKKDDIIIFCKPRIDLEKNEYDEELDLACEKYLEKNTVFINNYFLDEDGICEVCNEICWIKTDENGSLLIHAKDKNDFDNRVFESIQRIDNVVRKKESV